MTSHPYGMPNKLFRTSYSPAIPNNRPLSLNNSSFTSNLGSSSSHIRIQPIKNPSFVRDSQPNCLPRSQTSIIQVKTNLPRNDYYSQTRPEDLYRSLEQRFEELSKKVIKNTEEIKRIKVQSKSLSIKSECMEEVKDLKMRQQTDYQDCLNKIKSIREQITGNQSTYRKMIDNSPDKISRKIDQKVSIKIKNQIEERVKQQTAKIKLIIDNQISKISHQLRWELGKSSMQPGLFRSKSKYPFKSTKIVYSQKLMGFSTKTGSSRMSTKESDSSPSQRILTQNEQVYYVDRQGFLLDEDSYYILDSQQKMIRLSMSMLQQLRGEGLLQ